MSDANGFEFLAVEAEQLENQNTVTPPGADPVVDVPKVDTAELLLPLFSGLFTVITPAWKVTQPECKVLADVWSPVLDKYFPAGLGIEGTAILATVAILGPRMKLQRKSGAAAPGASASPFPTAPGAYPDGTINGLPVSEHSDKVH